MFEERDARIHKAPGEQVKAKHSGLRLLVVE